MKKYAVTIQAIVRKTITVEAADDDEANQLAREQFSVASTDEAEKYDEETIEVKEVK